MPLAAAVPAPITPRAFKCRCGKPVFFRNSECLACHTPLGYDAECGVLLPLEPADGSTGTSATGSTIWRAAGAGSAAPRYRRCANLTTAAACNWLLEETGARAMALCGCCRLTRTLPDLADSAHALWWGRIEVAKRRLVSSLIGLGLPVQAKVDEDPQRGLAFDLMRAAPEGPAIVTGHADGVITLDVEEADDVTREQRRTALHEPYRTLLGHLRHESGHYYWWRLVQDSEWLGPCRETFGDEREDYAAALRRHHERGASPDWGQRHVSAYASSHPWEDWAETWAHYLHMVDTLDTARSFGLDGESVELNYERYTTAALDVPADRHAERFVAILNAWMELTGVLNELSRSIGVPDFYPFVLSLPAVRKLHFIHRVISHGAAAAPRASAPDAAKIAADTRRAP